MKKEQYRGSGNVAVSFIAVPSKRSNRFFTGAGTLAQYVGAARSTIWLSWNNRTISCISSFWIIFLQSLDFIGVNSSLGICPDSNLIEIICAPPLQRDDFFDRSEVNMKYIAVKSHFPHIGRKVADAHICHTFPDFCLFILGQPDTNRCTPNTFLSCNYCWLTFGAVSHWFFATHRYLP